MNKKIIIKLIKEIKAISDENLHTYNEEYNQYEIDGIIYARLCALIDALEMAVEEDECGMG